MVMLFRILPKLSTSAKHYQSPLIQLAISLHRVTQARTIESAKEDYASSASSIGYLFGEALMTLAELGSDSEDVREGVRELDLIQVLRIWGWHRGVLEACAKAVDLWADEKE